MWVVAGTMDVHVTNAGDQAPDFKIVGDDGRTYTRADFGGKLLILNFWASWCGPCKTETPQLDALYREVKSTGIDIVGGDTTPGNTTPPNIQDKSAVRVFSEGVPIGTTPEQLRAIRQRQIEVAQPQRAVVAFGSH